MTSSKNTLQEYCVKQQLGDLIYDPVEYMGGPAHDPTYVCTVRIPQLKLSARGKRTSTKKDAQKSAASEMISMLYALECNGERNVQSQMHSTLDRRDTTNRFNYENIFVSCSDALQTLIRFCSLQSHYNLAYNPFILFCVDLDCVHSFPIEFNRIYNKNNERAFCLGFCSSAYTDYAKKHRLNSGFELQLIRHENTRRDATDMQLVAFLCMCLQHPRLQSYLNTIVIVSKDHMADAAVDAVRAVLPCMYRDENSKQVEVAHIDIVAHTPQNALALLNKHTQ